MYSGSFYDRQGRVVSVKIETVNDPGADSGKVVDLNEGEIRFLASGALELTWEGEGVEDVLVRQSGVMRIDTREFLPDFFRADCRDARVTVTRKKGNDARTMFVGYVLPRTYSQAYEEVMDTLEVNLISRLSVLQFLRWRGVGNAGVRYADEVAACGEISLREIVETCLVAASGGDFRNYSPKDVPDFAELSCPRMSEAEDALSALDGIKVSEALFMGDDEDGVWTLEEVLTEALRYLNRHIMEVGDNYVIFSWDDLKTFGHTFSVIGYDAEGYDKGATLEIGEVWNRFRVVCDAGESEETVTAPLDDDALGSPFRRRAWYCTEYWQQKGGTTADLAGFFRMCWRSVLQGYPANTWRRDWWVRVMDARGWRFYQTVGTRSGSREWNGSIPVDATQDAWLFYEQHNTASGTWENKVPDRLVIDGGAALLEVSTAKTMADREDNSIPTDVDSAKYMVIGVGGTALYPDSTYKDNICIEGELSAILNAKMQEGIPRAVYDGPSVNLSPTDTETTRYIDISGAVILSPVKRCVQGWTDFINRFPPAANPENYAGEFYALGTNRIKTGDDDLKEMYLRRCYRQSEQPQQWYTGSGEQATAGADGGETGLGLDMFETSETYKQMKFTGLGRISSSGDVVWDYTDSLSAFPVLQCMLIVGDKCVVQERTQNGSLPGGGMPDSFRWVKFKRREECADEAEFLAQSFYISMDLKLNDYAIGEEHKIFENAHFSLGIDSKGTVIPVRTSDEVSGPVHFLILRPVDSMWGVFGNGYIEATHEQITDRYGADVQTRLLNRVSAIWLKDFEINVISDNAGDDPLEDGEIVYTSDTSEKFVNEHEDVSFRICSALTAEERVSLGVRDVMYKGMAKDARTGRGVLSVYDPRHGETGKPEQLFVDWHYRECSEPHIELTHCIVDNVETHPMLQQWAHRALPGEFYALGFDRDLQAGTVTLHLREIK